MRLINMIKESINDEDAEEKNLGETEIEIFKTNEIDGFGESLYIGHKCFARLIQCIEDSQLNDEEKIVLKDRFEVAFPELRNFLNAETS